MGETAMYRTSRTFLFAMAMMVAGTLASQAEEPPAATKESAAADKGVAETVKQDAKVVGAAVKDGAQKVGVAAKEVAVGAADAAQQGAHEVATATKTGVAKTKAAVAGETAPKAEVAEGKAKSATDKTGAGGSKPEPKPVE
jgi:hypothetical protein